MNLLRLDDFMSQLDRNMSSKMDSFGLGICILQLTAPFAFEKNGTFPRFTDGWVPAELDDDQIEERLERIKTKIESDKSLSSEDQKIKLGLIEIAMDLLKNDPDERMTCQRAAKKLAQLQK
jgi:hypothetical protein